jgi:peptidoglycan/xylan/chitin deacetylase (PgdA/CDA1 family)
MLIYKKIIFFFFILLLALIGIDIFIFVGFFPYLILILGILTLLAYGSASIRSQFYLKSYCHAETDNKHIALTFDDGPDESVTPRLLNLLKAYQIEAAFFCIGKKAEKNPELITRIDFDGHIIGSHSYSHHLFFDLFSASKMHDELKKTDSIIKTIINKKIKWFRPPYGVTNPPLAGIVKKMNYHVIGWSLKSKDTVICEEEKLFNRLTKKIKPGDIILFHDTQPHIIEVLDKFIKFAKENNFTFLRPDRLLNIEAYE